MSTLYFPKLSQIGPLPRQRAEKPRRGKIMEGAFLIAAWFIAVGMCIYYAINPVPWDDEE